MLDDAAVKFAALAASLAAPSDGTFNRGRTPIDPRGSGTQEPDALQSRHSGRYPRLEERYGQEVRGQRVQYQEEREAEQLDHYYDGDHPRVHSPRQSVHTRKDHSNLDVDPALKIGAFLIGLYFLFWFGFELVSQGVFAQ